jgi:hypothetical protein
MAPTHVSEQRLPLATRPTGRKSQAWREGGCEPRLDRRAVFSRSWVEGMPARLECVAVM